MSEQDQKHDEGHEKPEAKAAQAQRAPGKSSKSEEKKSDKRLVKSLVNMSLHDGTQMVKGKEVALSQSDYERLKKDERGPLFQE